MVDSDLIHKTLLQNFHHIGRVEIDDQGHVSVHGSVAASSNFSQLPVTFSHVAGTFDLKIQPTLTTLVGCPNIVGGDFRVLGSILNTLEGAPIEIEGNARFGNQSHHDLKNLLGFPRRVGGITRVRYQPDLGMLRLLNTQKEIVLYISQGYEFLARDGAKVSDILNKYVGEGKRGAIRCQKELISAGFEGNARW
jgi:hypothetical protein